MTPDQLGGDEDGQTPVDADDAQYLTPAYAWIATRRELNDAEADNITDALLWLDDQTLTTADLPPPSSTAMVVTPGSLPALSRTRSARPGSPVLGRRQRLPVTEARRQYLAALRTADRGDYTDLLKIATN